MNRLLTITAVLALAAGCGRHHPIAPDTPAVVPDTVHGCDPLPPTPPDTIPRGCSSRDRGPRRP